MSAQLEALIGPTPINPTDILGPRRVFAVIGPSTNTVVQPDMEMMRPQGVTNQYRDIYVEDPVALSDDAFNQGAAKISAGMRDALATAVTCRPDYLVLGVSAISFVGGKVGCADFIAQVEDQTGLGISVGSVATAEALRAYGNVRRIAFVSPYYPTANANVRGFFSDYGFEIVHDVPLRCTSWTNIARVPEDHMRKVILALDADNVDAIVQVGTNLSMVRLAAEMEETLGKPVVAINTATYWHALRANGFTEKMTGFGRLLSDF
ncbi:arylmalonate decarboxylase [Novosphingobium sp. CECT 9465]|uniref:maleate cis-trans isomerase family protein n=1 Tax=Novosphingobium sp. CECT 9465 TaxID=2829794 RepID=UPI001E41DDEC|nr:arylmalonate decarboxylase [Novosphingobium sp. CECT 9465]CAH0495256.1 Maleate isomerase [Novosphingobium sp. CECT 9465]